MIMYMSYSIYGDQTQFIVNMLNLWWSSSIDVENAQCIVNMLNLWLTCSIYGDHGQFMVNMLHLWWTCSICDEHVQFMMNMLCLLDQKLEITFSMSADVYSDLTIGLALKNYHKMGLKLPKSIHWFKRYSEINFYISWCV